MSDLSVFYAQHVAAEATEEFVVSPRFKGEDGNPIAWKLRSMTEAENEECRKASTKRIKGKNGSHTSETNGDEYLARLAVASITYPSLKDAGLQQSYGVIGADQLLKKMLLPGEYVALVQKVQEINGFDKDMNEMVDEVKN